LAATLTKALDQNPRLPTLGDTAARAVTVNGTPAWRADTVDGFIYVTQNSPYRVLRWEPPSAASVLTDDLKKRQIPRFIEARTPLSNSRGMDITPVLDAGRLYGTVIQDTKALSNATTGGTVPIRQLDDGSGITCDHSGCQVTIAFSGPVDNATSKEYALTTVLVDLTIPSITIGDQQVAGCTSGLRPFRLTGTTLTGKLTCDNPQAGPVYDAVTAHQGAETLWAGTGTPSLTVHPLSSAEIDQLVTKEQHEQQSAGHA
jgi:hypothetical protein